MFESTKNLVTGATICLAAFSAGCIDVREDQLEQGAVSGQMTNSSISSAISEKRSAEANEAMAKDMHRIADALERLSPPPKAEKP